MNAKHIEKTKWIVTDDEKKSHIVFCKEDSNTEQDAILVLQQALNPTGEI